MTDEELEALLKLIDSEKDDEVIAQEMMEYYPAAYLRALQAMGKDNELRKLMKDCYKYRESYRDFTLYVIGYLDYKLLKLRQSK